MSTSKVSDLVDRLAEKQESTKVAARASIDALVETLTEMVTSGEFEKVVVPNLMTLVVTDKPARTGRNPSTGESIEIPAHKQIRAKITKSLKDAVRD